VLGALGFMLEFYIRLQGLGWQVMPRRGLTGFCSACQLAQFCRRASHKQILAV
jgi:hypothetical protein